MTGRSDELLTAIEAIHATGLEAGRWPDALRAVTRVSGAAAASVETYDFDRCGHRMWHGYGNEPEMVEAYLAFHSSANPYAPRRPAGARKFPRGHVLDAAGLGRDPFYADYITYTDPRYFAACILDGGGGPETVFTLTRDPSQGHVGREDVELFGRLMQHARMALQVSTRLEGALGEARALSHTLDLISGGAALLDDEGRVLHANAALVEMDRAGDGLSLEAGGVRFAASRARDQYGAAMSAALALRAGEPGAAPGGFAVSRPSGAPPLRLMVHPLFTGEWDGVAGGAAAVLFVQDPAAGRVGPGGLEALQASLGLTTAEAGLAGALLRGVSPVDYARERRISVNTAYTHLRRLKDKAGARRLSELICILNGATGAPA